MENVLVFRFMFKDIFLKCFGRKSGGILSINIHVFQYAGFYNYYEKYNCFMCLCVAINLNICNIIVSCIFIV